MYEFKLAQYLLYCNWEHCAWFNSKTIF